MPTYCMSCECHSDMDPPPEDEDENQNLGDELSLSCCKEDEEDVAIQKEEGRKQVTDLWSNDNKAKQYHTSAEQLKIVAL